MRDPRRSREGSRRLFFALWPTQTEQIAIERQMKSAVAASGGRAIPARNLHVTLVFLGEMSSSRFDAVNACAAETAAEGPLEVIFDRVETWSRSRVLCLASSEVPDALAQLVARLRFNLLREGFEIRHEEFRAHVTLARDVKERTARVLEPPFCWQFEQFVLVESQRGQAGSEYTAVARWPMSRSG